MIDQIQTIAVDQLRTIATAWGFVGTFIASLAGPVAVQRLKPYFGDSVIGKRNTKRRRLTLSTAAAAIDIGNVLTFLYFLLCFALAGFALMAAFWLVAIWVYWQEYRESRKAKKLTQQEYIDLLDGDS
jgi:hypothetical protein